MILVYLLHKVSLENILEPYLNLLNKINVNYAYFW